MAKIPFHVLVGSESPTRACFPFLQALKHKERGGEVSSSARGVPDLDFKDKNARFIILEQLAEMYVANDKAVAL